MTYEEELKAEIAAHMALYNRVLQTVQQVTLDGWTYQPYAHDQPHKPTHLGELVNPSIRGQIDFDLVPRDRKDRDDRLAVSVTMPRDRNGQYYKLAEEAPPSMTVSLTKTPLQIAKDIERRLLPSYIPMLARTVERIRATESGLDTVAANGRLLAERFPSLRFRDNTPTGTYTCNLTTVGSGDPHMDVTVCQRDVDMAISGLTLETAAQIIRLVLANRKDAA